MNLSETVHLIFNIMFVFKDRVKNTICHTVIALIITVISGSIDEKMVFRNTVSRNISVTSEVG